MVVTFFFLLIMLYETFEKIYTLSVLKICLIRQWISRKLIVFKQKFIPWSLEAASLLVGLEGGVHLETVSVDVVHLSVILAYLDEVKLRTENPNIMDDSVYPLLAIVSVIIVVFNMDQDFIVLLSLWV